MKQNILILTGSPRKGSNSGLMAEAFMRGAQEQGHTVTLFEAAAKHIAPCKACDTCWSTGRACTFSDDFTLLEPLLEQADTLALATPLYWYTFSAQIKAAMDRLHAYVMPNRARSLKIAQAVLLTCAASDDPGMFDGITGTFDAMLRFNQWRNAGVITVPGVLGKGDIRKTNALDRAHGLGARL